MRTAPAVTVDASLAGWARVTLAVLATWATAVGIAAAAARGELGAWLLALLVGVWAAALLRSAWRRPVLRLRWDGRGWWLGPAVDQGAPQAGEVAVALDLGPWLLLRFRPASVGSWRQRWLPLQRSQLPGQWQALRCAVYSPRPADDPPAVEAGRD